MADSCIRYIQPKGWVLKNNICRVALQIMVKVSDIATNFARANIPGNNGSLTMPATSHIAHLP